MVRRCAKLAAVLLIFSHEEQLAGRSGEPGGRKLVQLAQLTRVLRTDDDQEDRREGFGGKEQVLADRGQLVRRKYSPETG